MRRVTVLALTVLTLALAPARPTSADQGVVLRDVTFQPADATVEVGETVTWEHRDGSTPHTVTSTSGPASWDSNSTCAAPGNPVTCMTEGDTFERSFEIAGTYEYRCKVHSGMTGTVVVEPADDDTTTTSTTTTSTPPSTTTTAPPVTTAPPTTAAGAADRATTTAETLDEESAALGDGDDRGGGGAGGLAVILLTLTGVAAFLVWRFRPKPAIVVDTD